MIGLAEVAAARDALLAGGLAIVPTDTVYGLAAALDAPGGIEALYALKGRPRSQPCQVLVYTDELLAEALSPLDALTVHAARLLLPGPVTCIVPDPLRRYVAATGDRPGTVGIRAPSMTGPMVSLDAPLVATSANDPGETDPTTLAQVPARLVGEGIVALDAGPLPGTASTVVDLCEVATLGRATIVRLGPDPDGVARRLVAAGVMQVMAGE